MLLPPTCILTGFAGFALLETHQYVFTDDNTDAAGYRLFVRINPNSTFGSGSIAFFQISHLGALDGGVATVARVSVAEMAVDGIFIPFDAVWMRAGMTGAAASTAAPGTGLQLVMTPMDEGYEFSGSGALAIFISFLQLEGGLAGDTGGDCDDLASALCNTAKEDEICCYLKGDDGGEGKDQGVMEAPPLDADQYRYSRLSGRNGADAAVCFGGPNGIRMPHEAEDGTWVSSLNGLVESFNGPDGRCAADGICSLRIVIDAKTTVNFPLSNRIVNASDVLNESGYATFDVDSPGRITVTGFGRMSGLTAMAEHLDPETYSCVNLTPEYRALASSLWITGSGGPRSGSGWSAALGGGGYTYADGSALEDDGEDDATFSASRYGVVLEHVTLGYAPPVCESPVMLGDMRRGGDPRSGGASVLMRDFKYITFQVNGDGPVMRNPVATGMGNFLVVADDSIKTVTGVSWEVPTFRMLGTTLIGGYDEYGSAACPCCFGPATPYSGGAAACTGVLVRDLLMPIAHLNQQDGAGFGNNGVIRTNWGAFDGDCSTYFGCSFLQEPSVGPVAVDNIVFARWRILGNGWNSLNQPVVNFLMATNPAIYVASGPIAYVLASSRAVVFEDILSLIESPTPILQYSWGIGNASAVVEGTEKIAIDGTDEVDGGAINAQGIAAVVSPPSICREDVATPDVALGVCPTAAIGEGAAPLRPFAARGCAAYRYADADMALPWSPETWSEVCGYRLSADFDEASQTGVVIGDTACPGDDMCGLRFALFTESYSELYSRDVASWENLP